MKTSNWLRELPFILLIALPWIVFFYLGDSLPAQVPAHYSITSHGWVIDRYMSPLASVTTFIIVMTFIYLVMTLPAIIAKQSTPWLYYFKLALIIFFDIINIYTLTGADIGTATYSNLSMLALGLIVNGFIYWCFKAGKKMGKQPVSEKFYNIIWVGTHFFTTLPLVLGIFATQHWVSERTIPQAVFIFIAVTANLTNNVKPNHFIGIRTPWTLADEDVWRKTHRVSSRLFFIGGLVGFVVSVVAPVTWGYRLIFIVPVSCSVYTMVYSYWLYKKRVSV